ncbi:MAG TPA: DUF1587 domain-containing protein, partial [Polyangia bacterium]|nr:DUF1587 domain-containing protein [Polyangia bacterium]
MHFVVSGVAAPLLLSLVLATAGGCRGVISASGQQPSFSGTGGTTGTAGASAVDAGSADAAIAPLVPGRAPLRRLSNVEYDNTVRDLLGDKTQPALKFDPDTLADGFTNNADTQNVGTNLAQDYLT